MAKKEIKKKTRSELTDQRIQENRKKELKKGPVKKTVSVPKKKKVEVKKGTQPNTGLKKKPVPKTVNRKKRIVSKKPKRKIKYAKLILALLVLFFFLYLCYSLLNTSITNIYIKGNTYLSDQQVIEAAKLQNYPPTLQNLSFQIKSRLEKNTYIKKATVTKKGLFRVYLTIEENRPMFYYKPTGKTVLLDGTEVTQPFQVPTVINQIPDTKYQTFEEKMKLLEPDIINRISEIQYAPKDADDTRFMLKMTDGNYVYLNFSKFSALNNYVGILKKINNKKGILNLDAGNSFEIIE